VYEAWIRYFGISPPRDCGSSQGSQTEGVKARARTADEAAAVSAGMRRLRDDGLDKVRAGITSIAEVLRVLGT
jgi:type II secretory ATPase GspE/PulE/Tfp pilus assembly ATPase PilB-like protein